MTAEQIRALKEKRQRRAKAIFEKSDAALQASGHHQTVDLARSAVASGTAFTEVNETQL